MYRPAPPSGWAAFTAVGDPLVPVPLRRRGGRELGLLAVLGLGGIGLAVATRKRQG